MSDVPQADAHRSSPLWLALGLDALAIALLAYVVVTEGEGRDDDKAFLGDPLPDGLALLALVAVIAAGVVATRALVRGTAHRGLLLVPALIAASALIFGLGDLFVSQ